jgi:hypothetical protein
MKFNKYLTAAVVAGLMLGANATSIGRAGGGGGSHSSSVAHSSPSVSRPAPAPTHVAPAPSAAPAKPGGIGGTQSSVGVRKSEVTAPVAAQVHPERVNPAPGKPGSFSVPTSPAPTYGTVPAPVYQSAPSAGSTFMSSLGGSFAGTILGNAIFGGHGHGGGTTVINNGTPAPGTVAQAPGTVVDNGTVATNYVQPKKEYTVWSFIADLIGFVFVVAILLGIAWLFYKGFQLVRNYVNKERGVSNTPFNPTQRFWEIQKAFAAADVNTLNNLLGPDVVDELTNGLQASTLTLHNVSHEIRLQNPSEFSIWYKFEDDGAEVNQVWHYEKFGKDWKLNGIENV